MRWSRSKKLLNVRPRLVLEWVTVCGQEKPSQPLRSPKGGRPEWLRWFFMSADRCGKYFGNDGLSIDGDTQHRHLRALMNAVKSLR